MTYIVDTIQNKTSTVLWRKMKNSVFLFLGLVMALLGTCSAKEHAYRRDEVDLLDGNLRGLRPAKVGEYYWWTRSSNKFSFLILFLFDLYRVGVKYVFYRMDVRFSLYATPFFERSINPLPSDEWFVVIRTTLQGGGKGRTWLKLLRLVSFWSQDWGLSSHVLFHSIKGGSGGKVGRYGGPSQEEFCSLPSPKKSVLRSSGRRQSISLIGRSREN